MLIAAWSMTQHHTPDSCCIEELNRSVRGVMGRICANQTSGSCCRGAVQQQTCKPLCSVRCRAATVRINHVVPSQL